MAYPRAPPTQSRSQRDLVGLCATEGSAVIATSKIDLQTIPGSWIRCKAGERGSAGYARADRATAGRTLGLLGLRSLPAEFDLRIGVATGEVLVGSIGCELMMNNTVMGDTVNLASRLEGANKIYGCRILVSEPTADGAGDAVETREIDRIVVRRQSRPNAVLEIMGRKGALTEAQYDLRDRFGGRVSVYRARRWDESRRAFEAALLVVPDDGPSGAFISQLDPLAENPPDASWDACWRLDHK